MKRTTKNVSAGLSAAVLMALAGSSLAAMHETSNGTRAQVSKSDLVFVGSVVDVAYAAAGSKSGPGNIPHTFVTFDVEQVLHGKADGGQVTLRFIGGRGEESAFLAVSGQPMFDIGDRDLLMISGNNASGCPLVDCSAGRYRLIQDKVFSEDGQALEIDSEGNFSKVGYYDLPEVMTHKVSQTILQRIDQLDAGEQREEFDGQGKGAHIGEAQFVSRVRDTARSVGAATPGEFRSADITAQFAIDALDVAPPAPAVDDQPSDASATTDQERAELAALKANGGDPVIKKTNEKR